MRNYKIWDKIHREFIHLSSRKNHFLDTYKMLKNENRVQRNSIISESLWIQLRGMYNSEYDEKFPDNIFHVPFFDLSIATLRDFMYFLQHFEK